MRQNGRNLIAIVVPCHRVIGSSGKLTGFAGGLEAKAHLLQLENGGHLCSRSSARRNYSFYPARKGSHLRSSSRRRVSTLSSSGRAPVDRERISQAISETLQHNAPYDVEFRVVHNIWNCRTKDPGKCKTQPQAGCDRSHGAGVSPSGFPQARWLNL